MAGMPARPSRATRGGPVVPALRVEHLGARAAAPRGRVWGTRRSVAVGEVQGPARALRSTAGRNFGARGSFSRPVRTQQSAGRARARSGRPGTAGGLQDREGFPVPESGDGERRCSIGGALPSAFDPTIRGINERPRGN